MRQIEGGVTAAKGFEAAGAEAAVKYQNRKDMALIYSASPCRVAGTFTSNVVRRRRFYGTRKWWLSPPLPRPWW